jgi:hypothetical protein
MRYSLRVPVIQSLFLLLVFSRLAAQTHAMPNTPMQDLLDGPDRQELPWKVTIQPPRLMYQQRFIVHLRARIPGEAVSRGHQKLHFILKVKTDEGGWLRGEQFNDYPVPDDLGGNKEIEYATGVYLKPGNYTVALIGFESNSGKTSVIHRPVHVEEVKDDPFPELDRYIRTVEFPSDFPQAEVDNEFESDGELFPIAHQDDWVQINNAEPVLVDIVLNVTKRIEIPRPEPPRTDRLEARMRAMMAPHAPPSYHFEVGRLLQIGNVLAHLGLKSGCVRVSAIDVMRAKTIVDREDERKLDWDKFEARIDKFDQNTVDASVLANKKAPAQFLHKYLDAVSNDSAKCNGATRHYVVVVSHEVSLPGGAKEERLGAVNGERARFYYLHGGISGMGDDISQILKPVDPERLSFTSPRDFRKSFSRIVTEMRAGK